MTTYIKLEDAQKIIQGFYPLSESLKILEKGINSLTSINPESMIEEMLKECKEMRFSGEYKIGMIDALRELLQKFNS